MSTVSIAYPRRGTWPPERHERVRLVGVARSVPASILRVRRERALRQQRRAFTAILVVGLAGAVVSGAVAYRTGGPHGERAGSDPRVQRTYEAGTGNLTMVAFAADGSVRIDHWAYMDGERLLRLDIDDNHDGRVDRREYYGPGERLERTEYLDPGGQSFRAAETPGGRPFRAAGGEALK